MKPRQFEILLQEGEGTMLEYKESLSSSFARELVALANTLGGHILVGVRDDGSVSGVYDSNELRARIQDIHPVQVLVEAVGTGIRRIQEDVREQGCPELEFETNGFFTIIFRPNPSVRAQTTPNERQVTEHAEQVTDQVKKVLGVLGNEMLDATKNMTKLALSH